MLLLLHRTQAGHAAVPVQYPIVEFEGGAVDFSSVERAVRRTNEYFLNRVAYESLFMQYEAQCGGAFLTVPSTCVSRACTRVRRCTNTVLSSKYLDLEVLCSSSTHTLLCL
jgi:hypothetical protein